MYRGVETKNRGIEDVVEGVGQKMSVFVHAQGMKIVHAGGGGFKKMAKFCPRSF